MSPTAAARAKTGSDFRSGGVDPKRAGELLRQGRDGRGWTQAAAGRALGISERRVRAYEEGEGNPSVSVLAHAVDLYQQDREMLAVLFGLDPIKVRGVADRSPIAAYPPDAHNADSAIEAVSSSFATASDYSAAADHRSAAALCYQAALGLEIAIARDADNKPLYRAWQVQAYYLEGSYKRFYMPSGELLTDTGSRYREMKGFVDEYPDDRAIRPLPDLLYGHTYSALGKFVSAWSHLERALGVHEEWEPDIDDDMLLGALGAFAGSAGGCGFRQDVTLATDRISDAIDRGRYQHSPNVALALLGKARGYGLLAALDGDPKGKYGKTSTRVLDEALEYAPELLRDPNSQHTLRLQADCVRLDVADAAKNYSECLEICRLVLDRIDVYHHPRYWEDLTQRERRYDAAVKNR